MLAHPSPLWLVLATTMVASLVGGACSSSAKPASSNEDATDGAASTPTDSGTVPESGAIDAAPDSATAGGFIMATIDGEDVKATANVAAHAGARSTIELGAATSKSPAAPSNKVFIIQVPNAPGTYPCDSITSMTFSFNTGTGPISWKSDQGVCSVTVTQSAAAIGDFADGTFTATLRESYIDAATPAHVLTAGSFHVPRVD